MSLDTYADMIEQVVHMLDRPDLKAEAVDWLTLTEKELVLELRDLQEVMYESTGTFVDDQDYIDLPTGVRVLRHLRIDVDPPQRVNIVSMDKWIDVQAGAQASGVSKPIVATMTGSNRLSLQPGGKSTDGYTLFYWGDMAKIDKSKTTSNVLRESPNCLLYGAAVQSAQFTQNADGLQLWEKEYQKSKSLYGRYLSRQRLSGGALRVRPDTGPEARHTSSNIR